MSCVTKFIDALYLKLTVHVSIKGVNGRLLLYKFNTYEQSIVNLFKGVTNGKHGE